ncbi:MAG: hypothetical protein Q8P67_24515 [archaeon]|nr:hypothetical protein [archaeon]
MDSRQKAIFQRLVDKIVGPPLSGVALFQLKDIPLHDEHATTLFDLLGQYPQPFRLWLENVTPRRCNPTAVPEDETPTPEPVFGQLSKLLSSTASQLCFLTLNSHALSPDSLQTLVSSLHRHPHLQELTIHHTNLSSPQSAAALSQLLLPDLAPLSLESLSLWDDLISAEGICVLSQALKSNTSLLSLNLSRNRASDVGAAALATSLVQNNTLRRLLLFGNQVTDVGCIGMANSEEENHCSGSFSFFSSFLF